MAAGDAKFARSADGRVYAANIQDFEHPAAINVGPLNRASRHHA